MTEKHKPDFEKSKDMQDYFSALGYTLLSLYKPWRHIVGQVQKGGQICFLKLAYEDVSDRTRNEFAWNTQIHDLGIQFPVHIPKPVDSGEFDHHFWFTTEYINAPELCSSTNHANTDSLIKALPHIAQTAQAILSLPETMHLLRDLRKNVDLPSETLEKLDEWRSKTTSRDLTDLKQFVQSKKQYLQLAPQHGDFVPWHFKQDANGKLFLFDAEASSMKVLKFYDVAYFYHRVYTKLKRPDIASQFLRHCSPFLTATTKDRECFQAALAMRIAGGYFDAERDNITSVELQDELREKVLRGKILRIN